MSVPKIHSSDRRSKPRRMPRSVREILTDVSRREAETEARETDGSMFRNLAKLSVDIGPDPIKYVMDRFAREQAMMQEREILKSVGIDLDEFVKAL